ncbi:AraC family transcriptional regulator [Pseudoalteromonas lipolytica]|uniref:AraC family transcriptional regulator n=1 Tax=Pseudoalteromonas lipolytica TaxID=570156 RepID=UPI000AE34901|nr:AraC family transcriptional regulator [Pseudoalteromonas lipolytica]
MRTLSSWWLRAMAESFKWQGLPINELFENANIRLTDLSSQSARYPQAHVSLLWKQAQAMLPNTHLGVYVGSNMNVRAIPVVGMAIIQSTQLLSAFRLILRYQKLMGDTHNVSLIDHGEEYELRFNFSDGERDMSLLSYEAPMAFCLKIARTVKGKDWCPTRICLQRKEPNAEIDEHFNCPIEYAAKTHSLFFSEQVQSQVLLSSNIKLASQSTVTQILRILLEEHLIQGQFSCAVLAKSLNMSEKTLQRRLAKEGTNFSKELALLRKQKSVSLLTETDLSLTEIAFLCGYSELSAFHHAFNRWYGVSPKVYREQMIALA